MSEQSNQATQSAVTSEELRQSMVDALNEVQQVVEELSDEELEAVAGGVSWKAIIDHYNEFKPLYQKTAATTIVTAVGGGATAAGVHK